MGARLEISILGPLEVTRDGSSVVLPAGMQRALLALLAVSVNQVVPRERIVDQLWGDRPPETAATSLHGLVSQLRKALEPERHPGDPGTVIRTRPPGYELALPPEALDAARFEQRFHEGGAAAASGDLDGARRCLVDALALWRGPALADVRGPPDLQAESIRLDEMRLEALERRIAVDLELGRHDELVPELEALVAREPLRERLREQLMTALYRAGRQADALEEYRRARGTLRDELGVEPGPELRGLEQQILRQEPGLAPPRPHRPPSARRRTLGFAALGALVVAALAAVPFWRLASSDPASLVAAPGSVAVIDPSRGRVIDVVPVAAGLASVAYGHGSVWAASADDGTVTRIDPQTRRSVKAIGIGKPCVDLAIGADAVWIANGSAGTLTRVDPVSNTVAKTIDLSGPDPVVSHSVQAVAVGQGWVWAVAGPGLLHRLDPTTGELDGSYQLGGAGLSIATGLGSVWVGTVNERVLRLDPRTGRVTARALVLGWPVDVEVADGRVIVSASSVWVLDPDTALPAPTPRVDTSPTGAADVPGPGAWVAERSGGDVVELVPAGREGRSPVPVGRDPSAIAYGAGLLWVAVREPEVS